MRRARGIRAHKLTRRAAALKLERKTEAGPGADSGDARDGAAAIVEDQPSNRGEQRRLESDAEPRAERERGGGTRCYRWPTSTKLAEASVGKRFRPTPSEPMKPCAETSPAAARS